MLLPLSSSNQKNKDCQNLIFKGNNCKLKFCMEEALYTEFGWTWRERCFLPWRGDTKLENESGITSKLNQSYVCFWNRVSKVEYM